VYGHQASAASYPADNFIPGNPGQTEPVEPRTLRHRPCQADSGQKSAGPEHDGGQFRPGAFRSKTPGLNPMGDRFEPGAFIVVIVTTPARVTRNPKSFQKVFQHGLPGRQSRALGHNDDGGTPLQVTRRRRTAIGASVLL
jgi:hypothetical protein